MPADSPELWPATHLPYGVASLPGERRRRVVTRVGDDLVDLGGLAAQDGLPQAAALAGESLDALLALGRDGWTSVRGWLLDRLGDSGYADRVAPHRHPLAGAALHLPWTVADYVDFYSSRHHAENVGRLFRPGSPPLTPNWLHLPIGYHGRAGTVVVSGTDVVRPSGQRKAPDDERPSFGPSQRLDLEAEVGFVVGTPSALGEPVPAAALADHVLGLCLVNDWSARDVQAWEYVPLGPFLGKSFCTSVSPWVVPLDALAAARVAPPPREVPLLPYLADDPAEPWGLRLDLEVELQGVVVSRPPFAGMYWTPAQQLAHLTVNGAALRTGDLYASGTVSGPERDQVGSLLELTRGGAEPVDLGAAGTRGFLADGDVLTVRGTAPGPDGAPVSLGEVTGRVLPAR